jgi:hypothetical protein
MSMVLLINLVAVLMALFILRSFHNLLRSILSCLKEILSCLKEKGCPEK